MPSAERDASRESNMHLKHQHSLSSDTGKAIVPMWDSSDPERAPPPLPMNPSSPSLVSRTSTSSAIQSAHAALTEKARETGFFAIPTQKRIDQSPERFLVKEVAHKRLKSLQPGVRDISNYLEAGTTYTHPRSPEKSSNRSGAAPATREAHVESRPTEKEPRYTNDGRFLSRSQDRDVRLALEKKSWEMGDKKECETEEEPCRSEIPVASSNDTQRQDLSNPRASFQRSPKSILGENIPPQSATMLALQSMASRDHDIGISNSTNSSTALVRTPQTFDAISNQILSLTSIATSLQREMAQLSRRSKDNATDLVSLKEATNARDEDIRKSLRELVQNLNEATPRSSSNTQGSGGLYIDNKAHNSPASRGTKSYNVTHMSSPSGYAASIDRESIISPTSYVADGFAIIALLEKVLRDMGTKEGQDQLLSHLSELFERLSYGESTTTKKVDELMKLIKDNTSNALVTTSRAGTNSNKNRTFSFDESSKLELEFDHSKTSSLAPCITALSSAEKGENKATEADRVSNVLNEEMVKIIRTVKDSVTQGGGLTAEVKALVRELRGEVLGMGREIGRKLDESNDEAAKSFASDKEHISRLAKNSVDELKTHLDQILREYRRQSTASFASRSIVDYQEIHNSTRKALQELHAQNQGLQKEDVFEAVKDAWENYKPEIEFQQFGLEREELLACLKEGLEMYNPQKYASPGATREEVFEAIEEGLKHFPLPHVEPQINLSREEILEAFKECLEEYEFPSAPPTEPVEKGITKDDVLYTVMEGLNSFDFTEVFSSSVRDSDDELTHKNLVRAVKEGLKSFHDSSDSLALTHQTACHNLNREDVLEAVKSGLSDAPGLDAIAGQIFKKLQEIIDSIHTEFQSLSKDAKDNLISSENVSQQLLDVNNDGFDRIRADIKYFADKAANFEEKRDSILESFTQSLENIRLDLASLAPKEVTLDLKTIHTEVENLRNLLSASIISNTGAEKNDIKDVFKSGLESINETIVTLIASSSAAEKSEVLNALHEGFNSTRSIITSSLIPTVSPDKDEILEAIKSALDNFRETMSTSLIPESQGIGNKEISEAVNEAFQSIIHTMSTSLVTSTAGQKDEILNTIRNGFDGVKENIASLNPPTSAENASSRNDELINFLKDNIESVKETITSSIFSSNATEKEEIIATIRDIILNHRESNLTSQAPSSKDDDASELKDDIIGFLKSSVDEVKGDIAAFSTFNITAEKHEIISTIEANIESLKETVITSFIASTATDKDEINRTLQDGLGSIKETISASSDNATTEKTEIINAIRDNVEGLKENFSSSIVSSTVTGKDEIINAIRDNVEGLKENFSSSIVSSTVTGKDEIIGAIKGGFEGIGEKISNSLVTNVGNNNTIDALKEEFENMKDLISRSIVSNAMGEHKLALESVKDVVNTIRDKLSNSVVFNASAEKNEIVEVFRTGVDSLRETMSKSLIPCTTSGDIDAQKDQILECLKNGLKDIQETLSTSISSNLSNEKDNILQAVKDESGNLQRIISTSLTSAKSTEQDDILTNFKDVIDNFKETLTSTMVPNPPDEKREILEAIKNGFDSAHAAMSNSLVSRKTLENNEIKEVLAKVLEEIKEKISTSLASSDTNVKDEITNAFKDNIESFKEIVAASQVSNAVSEKNLALEALKDEFENLKESMLTSFAAVTSENTNFEKDDIMQAIKDEVEGIKETILISIVSNTSSDKDEIISSLKDEIHSLKETIPTILTSSATSGKDEIISVYKDNTESLKEVISTSLSSSTSAGKDEIITTLKNEFDGMKEVIHSSLASATDSEKNKTLEALKDSLESIKENLTSPLTSETSEKEKNDFLKTLKECIENFMDEIKRSRETDKQDLTKTNQSLDTLKNNLGSLHSEVEKIANKSADPVEVSPNDEILSTLKTGLENVRSDIDQLRENFLDKRLNTEAEETAIVPIDTLKRHDIEKLETMLNQLRIKVEDIESSSSRSPSSSEITSRSDLPEFEATIKNVERLLTDIAVQTGRPEGDVILRDDVKAIETLLRNMNTKIEELDSKSTAQKEDLDPIKHMLEETQNKVNNFANSVETLSKKSDVQSLENFLQDALTSIQNLKDIIVNDNQNPERITKTDVDAVEATCLDIKTSIDQILTSDIATLASNEDVKNLEDQVKELRERIDSHAESNVKSFEQRQSDIQGVGGKVSEVKTILEEFKDTIKTELGEGVTGIGKFGEILGSIEEKFARNNFSEDINALIVVMKEEFEKSNAGVVGSKLESDEKFQQTWDKIDTKLDGKLKELLTKYDDAKTTVVAASELNDQKTAKVEVALQETQVAIRDIKEIAGHINTSVTKSMEKIDESSQGVIDQVNKFHSMIENSYTDIKVGNQLTRDDMAKTLASVERVDDILNKHNPKIIGQIEDFVSMVGKHFEYSKTSMTSVQDKIMAELSALKPPPPLLPAPQSPAAEKSHEASVLEKLDTLIENMNTTDKSLNRLGTLDEIYQEVKKNAAEVSGYFSEQNKRNIDDHKEKEKAAQAAAISLERKLTKKKFVEAAVAELREEEKQLKASISELKAETEDLTQQKMRLFADVSSLETALKIRREELQIVEARAEGLERRILEGVIDHSRALLISKANKGRDAMNRKRVPSYASSASNSSSTSLAPSLPRSTVNVVIGTKGSTLSVPLNNSPGVSRRILSLSQINNNLTSGGFKRSHSVKVPSGSFRKSSWAGTKSHKYDESNDIDLDEKENMEREASDMEDSDDETIRRSSIGASQFTAMDSEVSESTTNLESDYTESDLSSDTRTEDYSDTETIVMVEPERESEAQLEETTELFDEENAASDTT